MDLVYIVECSLRYMNIAAIAMRYTKPGLGVRLTTDKTRSKSHSQQAMLDVGRPYSHHTGQLEHLYPSNMSSWAGKRIYTEPST